MISYLLKNMRCMSPEVIDLVYTHTTLGCDATLRNATCNELAGQLTGFLGPACYSAYKRWGDTAAPKVCKEKSELIATGDGKLGLWRKYETCLEHNEDLIVDLVKIWGLIMHRIMRIWQVAKILEGARTWQSRWRGFGWWDIGRIWTC
jgi:hypothetical protein